MRLLYAINGLGTGGAERSLAELLPHLEAAGIHTTVACLVAGRSGVESDVVRAGFDVRFLGGSGIRRWVGDLRALIRNERPDLVQTTHFEADIAGRLAARGTGIPVLTSLVNTPYDPARRRDPTVPLLRLRAARTLDVWTARRLTTHFHAITHAVKAAAVKRLGVPAERITVVERGRDPERLGVPGPARRARARRALGLHATDEVVLAVGRREFQKGHRYLMEAADELLAERPRLVVLLAGRDGSASEDLERMRTATRDPSRVQFLGHRSEVPDLLAAADVFAFPSLYEGLGCSVIEAMALGLPVVASNIPAIREVVADERSGVLVPPADGRALASGIRRMLDDPMQATSMGQVGRSIFAERFRLELSAARMIDLYRSIVRETVPTSTRRAS